MPWIRTALMLVALAFGLGFSPQALASEAPPMRTVETVESAPPIYLSGRHLNPDLQLRLTRERPYRPVAGMALGLGLGLAGGVIGVGIAAPLLIVGLPLALVTGTVGVASGAALGAWRFGGDAPFWWTAVGAGLGMGVAASIQVGLILAGVAAAVTVVGLPVAILLAGGAVAVGLIAMPLGANIAARIHQKRPVPRVLFREPTLLYGDAQADALTSAGSEAG
ncbi:MAG: hypothetical protein VX899_10820 [Myxococcota bacterium]|nr:hypothetical protein [Myxococcota bacterium]